MSVLSTTAYSDGGPSLQPFGATNGALRISSRVPSALQLEARGAPLSTGRFHPEFTCALRSGLINTGIRVASETSCGSLQTGKPGGPGRSRGRRQGEPPYWNAWLQSI